MKTLWYVLALCTCLLGLVLSAKGESEGSTLAVLGMTYFLAGKLEK